MERGRVLEEKRRTKRGSAKSFDDLVDEDGVLKKNDDTSAKATSTETQPEAPEMRKRKTEAQGAAMGATLANPFVDEIPMEFYPAEEQNASAIHSRSTTPTLASPWEPGTPPETPRSVLIDADEISNHPSEALVELTPTTSASNATSPHHNDLASLSPISAPANDNDEAPPPAPWSLSIEDWADNGNTSFYSAPQSQSTHSDPSAAAAREDQISEKGPDTPTVSESGEHVSQIGSEDVDVLSEFGGVSTPGTWTEVGSVTSEDY